MAKKPLPDWTYIKLVGEEMERCVLKLPHFTVRLYRWPHTDWVMETEPVFLSAKLKTRDLEEAQKKALRRLSSRLLSNVRPISDLLRGTNG